MGGLEYEIPYLFGETNGFPLPHPHTIKCFSTPINFPYEKVSQLIDTNVGAWNLPKLESTFLSAEVDDILQIPLDTLNIDEDAVILRYDQSEMIIAKAGYWLLQDSINQVGTYYNC